MSPHSPQELEIQEKLEILRDMCRKTGLKLTHQLLEIFRELASTEDHPSAEKIHRRIQARMPSISLDTVYRTLSTFELHGLIAKVCVSEDRARFCGHSIPHHHLFCTRCKDIVDLNWDNLDQIEIPPETKESGRINLKRLILEGICSRYLQEQEE